LEHSLAADIGSLERAGNPFLETLHGFPWLVAKGFSDFAALRAAINRDPHRPMAESRALALYQHAKRSGDDKGKLAALLDAFLAIPSKAKSTTERIDHAEIVTVKQGRRIIWRSYRTLPKRKAAKA
jgi:hypothetical protein